VRVCECVCVKVALTHPRSTITTYQQIIANAIFYSSNVNLCYRWTWNSPINKARPH